MKTPRFAIVTLGCKVNRSDADALVTRLSLLARQVSFDDEADLYIINSCTVTAAANRQSRQVVYRARRRNPVAKIIFTGCMVTDGTDQVRSIPQVDHIFGPFEHDNLIDLVRDLAGGDQRGILESAGPDAPGQRTRPVLKIQDGCDYECSYCIVRLARGPSRSTSTPAEVARTLRDRFRAGFREVVLSGIHLGLYGQDLDPPLTLSSVLPGWLKSGPRLRLSSIDPLEVDPALITLLETSQALCQHLHIPIQSGDDTVLEKMNRQYDASRILSLLERLRRRAPDIALGTDLIAGFPGEGDRQFEQTMRLVKESPLTHLHAFPFSPRPGTAAFDLPGQVPTSVSKARVAALREEGRGKLRRFMDSQLGKTRRVLVERVREDGVLIGLTDNYLRVAMAGSDCWTGALLEVELTEIDDNLIRGRVVTGSG